MEGIIDLELYTIAVIRLNNALEKLQEQQLNDEIILLFKESSNDFQELYSDIISDLNQNEILFDEYYLFFENWKQLYPKYMQILESIEHEKLKDSLDSLKEVFNNLKKTAEDFSIQMGMVI